MKPAILGVAGFVAGAAISAAVLASSAAPADKKAIEAIVHDYILAHPDVIVESVKKWQEGEGDRQALAAKDTIKSKHDIIYNDASDAFGGNPKGDVTVVEFFDYNCPACKMMFKGLEELIKNDSDVKVVFKEMPIFGEQSNQNSAVGLAVSTLAPEKYLAFHEGMMAHQGRPTPEDAIKIAVGLGLNKDEIRKEMDKEAITKKIQENHLLADQLGVRGTPAIVIGDTLIPSAIGYEELKKLVAEQRK